MESRRILLGCTLAFSIVLEYLVRSNDWWHLLGGHMDSVMHFFWGLNVFLLLVIALRWKPLDALYGVFAWQMAWELVEMVGDVVITQTAAMIDIFWWDGIKDTVVDLLGAGLGWFLLTRIRGGLEGLRDAPYRTALRTLPVAMFPGIVAGGVIGFATGSSPQAFAVAWILLAMAYSAWQGIRNEPTRTGSPSRPTTSRGPARRDGSVSPRAARRSR